MKIKAGILLLKGTIYFLWLGGFVSGPIFFAVLNPLSAVVLYKYLKKEQKNPLYPVIVLLVDLLIPFVGFVALIIFYFCGFVFRFINFKDDEEDFFLPMGPSSYQAFEMEKKIALQSQYDHSQKDQDDILSFMEVEPLEQALLGDGDLQLKISAIDQLSRIGSRKAISILKKGLKLEEYEVRYFANGALEEVEKAKLQEIKKISESVAENPDNAEAYKERGAAYLEMFRLGLLDKSIEKVFLEKALLDFMTSLSLKPSQSYLYTRIIEVNLLLEKYDELLHLADYALKTNLSEMDRAKIYFYKAEASYIKKDYAQAQIYCEKASVVNTDFITINSCLEWWKHAG